MDLIFIILIILAGLVFMFIEMFLIPGTAILTLFGFVIIGIGVYIGYDNYGSEAGTWLLIGSILGAGVTLYIGYNRIKSKRWALQTNNTGKVNNEDVSSYKPGDNGKTFSVLRPEGKAVFQNDERVTVYSIGNFIDKDRNIEIVKVERNKIFVKEIFI